MCRTEGSDAVVCYENTTSCFVYSANRNLLFESFFSMVGDAEEGFFYRLVLFFFDTFSHENQWDIEIYSRHEFD